METAVDNPFAAILSDGETILWQGQPNFDSQLQAEQRQIKVVAAIFFVLALSTWITGDKVSWYFTLMFLFVACATILVTVASNSRFKGYDWYYAVTDKRVLFYDPHGDGDDVMRSVPLRDIKKVHLRLTGTNDAELVFEAKFLARHNQLTFYHVTDAAEVQKSVVSLLPGARQEARK